MVSDITDYEDARAASEYDRGYRHGFQDGMKNRKRSPDRLAEGARYLRGRADVLAELAERVDKFYAMPVAQAVMSQWISDLREEK